MRCILDVFGNPKGNRHAHGLLLWAVSKAQPDKNRTKMKVLKLFPINAHGQKEVITRRARSQGVHMFPFLFFVFEVHHRKLWLLKTGDSKIGNFTQKQPPGAGKKRRQSAYLGFPLQPRLTPTSNGHHMGWARYAPITSEMQPPGVGR